MILDLELTPPVLNFTLELDVDFDLDLCLELAWGGIGEAMEDKQTWAQNK